MIRTLLFIGCLFVVADSIAQGELPVRDSLPYVEAGDFPADYGPGSIIARTIDGLGYRYHWATKGLTDGDLATRPTPEARSLRETLDHLYNLSVMTLNAGPGAFVERQTATGMSFTDLRAATLRNLSTASERFRGLSPDDFEALEIRFRNDGSSGAPIWYLLNGPLADAIYHTGQVVTLRRMNGNPMNPNVNVFRGRNR